MRHLLARASGLGLVVVLATAATAQQPPASGGDTAPGMPRMGMARTMTGCDHHATLTADLAKALTTVREARQSADLGTMSAALIAAERSMTGMQTHLTGCAAKMASKGTMKMECMGRDTDAQDAAPSGKADEHKH